LGVGAEEERGAGINLSQSAVEGEEPLALALLERGRLLLQAVFPQQARGVLWEAVAETVRLATRA